MPRCASKTWDACAVEAMDVASKSGGRASLFVCLLSLSASESLRALSRLISSFALKSAAYARRSRCSVPCDRRWAHLRVPGPAAAA